MERLVSVVCVWACWRAAMATQNESEHGDASDNWKTQTTNIHSALTEVTITTAQHLRMSPGSHRSNSLMLLTLVTTLTQLTEMPPTSVQGSTRTTVLPSPLSSGLSGNGMTSSNIPNTTPSPTLNTPSQLLSTEAATESSRSGVGLTSVPTSLKTHTRTPSPPVSVSSSVAVETTEQVPKSTGYNSIENIPLWVWITVGATVCVLVAIVLCSIIVIGMIKCRSTKGSYTVTSCEEATTSTLLTQQLYPRKNSFGNESVSLRQSTLTSHFVTGHSHSPRFAKTKGLSHRERSSSESSINRVRRSGLHLRSLSRPSVANIRRIDMKLDLVYSPSPMEESTSFSYPSYKKSGNAATSAMNMKELHGVDSTDASVDGDETLCTPCSADFESEDTHVGSDGETGMSTTGSLASCQDDDNKDEAVDSDTDLPIIIYPV